MKDIDITILNDPVLRQRFVKKFLLSWNDFQLDRKDFIKNIAETHKINFDEKMYNESLMWDKMPSTYKDISFTEALDILKSMDQKVIFMSETDNYPSATPLTYRSEEIPSFIAQVNATDLAFLIEYEWFESYRLAAQNMYNPDFILPEDLYVQVISWRNIIMNYNIHLHHLREWCKQKTNDYYIDYSNSHGSSLYLKYLFTVETEFKLLQLVDHDFENDSSFYEDIVAIFQYFLLQP